MLVEGTGRLNDAVMWRPEADMVRSLGPGFPALECRGWAQWLLFDYATFAFAFASFGSAGGGDLTRLHELADVSGSCKRLDL
jgi:hypothetical protein